MGYCRSPHTKKPASDFISRDPNTRGKQLNSRTTQTAITGDKLQFGESKKQEEKYLTNSGASTLYIRNQFISFQLKLNC
jgi:hypothetical protein